MPRSAVVAVGSLVALAGIVSVLWWREPAAPERPLVVLAAPTVRVPLDAVVADYARETGRGVLIDWGPSARLVNTARFPAPHRAADILLPADDSYLVQARDAGLLDDWTPLAGVRAVLLLAPNNPKGIAGWPDLHADGVRVAVPNDGAAVGKLTREHLTATGRWPALRPQVKDVMTVTEAANAAKVGSADAAVVWDAVAAGPGYRGQTVLRVPELDGVRGQVAAGVLKQSPNQADARRFLEYLSNPERGRKRFREAGFTD